MEYLENCPQKQEEQGNSTQKGSELFKTAPDSAEFQTKLSLNLD